MYRSDFSYNAAIHECITMAIPRPLLILDQNHPMMDGIRGGMMG